ncbi:MAG: hypothetical protein V4556_14105 [Bacteroidota bacterium]
MSTNYFTLNEFRDLHTAEGFNTLMGLMDEIKNDKEQHEKFFVKDGDLLKQIKYSSETDSLYLSEPGAEIK